MAETAKGGWVQPGMDRLGQHAAQRIGERHLLGGKRREGRDDASPGFGNRQHQRRLVFAGLAAALMGKANVG